MFHRDCRCGHMWAAHGHYRTGLDCALCQCIIYQPRPWWRRRDALQP